MVSFRVLFINIKLSYITKTVYRNDIFHCVSYHEFFIAESLSQLNMKSAVYQSNNTHIKSRIKISLWLLCTINSLSVALYATSD